MFTIFSYVPISLFGEEHFESQEKLPLLNKFHTSWSPWAIGSPKEDIAKKDQRQKKI